MKSLCTLSTKRSPFLSIFQAKKKRSLAPPRSIKSSLLDLRSSISKPFSVTLRRRDSRISMHFPGICQCASSKVFPRERNENCTYQLSARTHKVGPFMRFSLPSNVLSMLEKLVWTFSALDTSTTRMKTSSPKVIKTDDFLN